MPRPAFHAYTARYPDPNELDADGMCDGEPVADVDVAEIEAAIEAEGWCGCWHDRLPRPVVVVPFGAPLPAAAERYLRQR